MTTLFQQHLAKQLGELLQKKITITTVREVHGGDINRAYAAETNEGRFFIKVNTVSLAGIFQKETYGLLALKTQQVLKIPDPVYYGMFEDTLYLVLEYLEKEKPTSQTWRLLGEGIAALHQQTQPRFGLSYPNFIGSLAQSNTPADSWAEFYASQRIMPLVKKAFDNRLCTAADVNDAEQICNRLEQLFPKEPPALLHGDLWSGNVMACANNNAAVYDPATYYGHREMDVAMTLLFGGFDESFYRHYNEWFPLQKEWQQRVALCQLYPLLVHLHLFGSGYYNQVKSVLKKYR